MAPNPVTIRTLDVGGDKFVPEINLSDEMNPAMGLRGIRFSLNEKVMLNIQLRAILRASAKGPVRVMFPMITGVAELRECLKRLELAKAELREEGVEFNESLQVGFGSIPSDPRLTLMTSAALVFGSQRKSVK